MIRAIFRRFRPAPVVVAPIRCIQVGSVTLQGRVVPSEYGEDVKRRCVRYVNGSPVMADYARIDTGLRVVWGRLIDGKEVGA